MAASCRGSVAREPAGPVSRRFWRQSPRRQKLTLAEVGVRESMFSDLRNVWGTFRLWPLCCQFIFLCWEISWKRISECKEISRRFTISPFHLSVFILHQERCGFVLFVVCAFWWCVLLFCLVLASFYEYAIAFASVLNYKCLDDRLCLCARSAIAPKNGKVGKE